MPGRERKAHFPSTREPSVQGGTTGSQSGGGTRPAQQRDVHPLRHRGHILLRVADLRLLRGCGQRLSAIPRLSTGPVRQRQRADFQVELYLP